MVFTLNIEHSSSISSKSLYFIPPQKSTIGFLRSGRLKFVFCRPLVHKQHRWPWQRPGDTSQTLARQGRPEASGEALSMPYWARCATSLDMVPLPWSSKQINTTSNIWVVNCCVWEYYSDVDLSTAAHLMFADGQLIGLWLFPDVQVFIMKCRVVRTCWTLCNI